jgi:putative spermidine/putrescine transport system permease protein
MSDAAIVGSPATERTQPHHRHWTDALLVPFRGRPWLRTLALLLPGTLWMAVFVLVPLGSIVLFSFWKSGYLGLRAEYNLDNYTTLGQDASVRSITLWTLELVALVLVGAVLIAYPVAYALWRLVRSQRVKMAILLLMIIPFWTSYLIRTITWLPMFGVDGIVNTLLIHLGIAKHPLTFLLYSRSALLLALWFLYTVFVVGPLYWSMSRIDEDVISAAAVFGARPWKTFTNVVFPLSKPGLMAGALFTVIFTMGEFFTEETIGGGTDPTLAQLIINDIYVFQWSGACAIAVLLTAITVAIVTVMLRFFDIRKI